VSCSSGSGAGCAPCTRCWRQSARPIDCPGTPPASPPCSPTPPTPAGWSTSTASCSAANQALGCSPVAQAWEAGTDVCRPVKPDTIAKSLAIGNPADGPYAVDLARRTGGGIDSVTDDEIRAGIKLLAETTGIFTETAGGVTTAVLAKLAERGEIDPSERVVAYITGDGLKTLDAVREGFEVTEIAPSLEAFDDAFAPAGAVA